MNLEVKHGVGIWEGSVEDSHKEVQDSKVHPFSLEESALIVSFFVQEHVQVGKTSITRQQSQEVIRQQSGDLKSISDMSAVSPVEQRRSGDREPQHWEKIRSISLIFKQASSDFLG